MPTVTIDQSKCTLQRQCIAVCPVAVFEEKDGKMLAVRPEDCTVCRACEAACPQGAIKVDE